MSSPARPMAVNTARGQSDEPTPTSAHASTSAAAPPVQLAVLPGNDDDDAPLPPAEIAAAYERLEDEGSVNKLMKVMGGKPEIIEGDEAPVPFAQMYAKGNLETIEDDVAAPLPANYVADASIDDLKMKKTAATPDMQQLDSSPRRQQAMRPSTGDATTIPPVALPTEFHNSADTSVNAVQEPVIVYRPTPRSMLPHDDSDADMAVPSIPMFHEVEATVVREEPVYDATPMQIDDTPRPWWEKYLGRLLGGMGLLVGLAIAVPVGLRSSKISANDNGSVGLVSSTNQPTNSMLPTFQPSVSLVPTSYWSALTYKQLGVTFYGYEVDDQFGHSVSFSQDGTTLAIGSNHLQASRRGYVQIYRWDRAASNYRQLGDTIYGDIDGDQFGYSVSLIGNGTTLAVGAPLGKGLAKVYRWDEDKSNYTQLGDTLYGDAYGDRFGMSLSLIGDGTTLAISASEYDQNRPGYAKVYRWDEDKSNYTQLGRTLYGDRNNDGFGWNLSVVENNRTILAIGADQRFNDGPGYVKVYRLDEDESNYKQLGDTINGTTAGDKFGISVSVVGMDEVTLAIGANQYDTPDGPGYVKMYRLDKKGSNFEQLGQTLKGDAKGCDRFGRSLSLSPDGTTVAIGAHQYGNNCVGKGYVKVYGWDEHETTFKQLGYTLYGDAANDGFGLSVSLVGKDGTTLAIGASQTKFGEPGQGGTGSGYVKVFTR